MLVLSLIISLTFLMILHQAATGTGHFVCRQSYNCSYQVYISIRGKKLHFIPNPAWGLQPSASVWEGSLWMSQTVPMPIAWSSPQGRSRNGTSVGVSECCHSAPEAEWHSVLHGRKGSTLLQVTLGKKKPTQAWKAVLPDSSRNTAFTLV